MKLGLKSCRPFANVNVEIKFNSSSWFRTCYKDSKKVQHGACLKIFLFDPTKREHHHPYCSKKQSLQGASGLSMLLRYTQQIQKLHLKDG